jgi:tryptophanyl-tRNA synthetase
VLRSFAGARFSTFKNALIELSVAKLTPIRAEILRLAGDPGHVDDVLAQGARKAREIALPTMNSVKDILGLVR